MFSQYYSLIHLTNQIPQRKMSQKESVPVPKMLTRCPICEAALGVSELQCGRCKTTIHGTFSACRFCRLAPEHFAFLEMFLRHEGNLSRVEKDLNLSYPTVRNKLQAAIAGLGFTGEADGVGNEGSCDRGDFDDAGSRTTDSPKRSAAEISERRNEVLTALARGDMSADDAAVALRDLT